MARRWSIPPRRLGPSALARGAPSRIIPMTRRTPSGPCLGGGRRLHPERWIGGALLLSMPIAHRPVRTTLCGWQGRGVHRMPHTVRWGRLVGTRSVRLRDRRPVAGGRSSLRQRGRRGLAHVPVFSRAGPVHRHDARPARGGEANTAVLTEMGEVDGEALRHATVGLHLSHRCSPPARAQIQDGPRAISRARAWGLGVPRGSVVAPLSRTSPRGAGSRRWWRSRSPGPEHQRG